MLRANRKKKFSYTYKVLKYTLNNYLLIMFEFLTDVIKTYKCINIDLNLNKASKIFFFFFGLPYVIFS